MDTSVLIAALTDEQSSIAAIDWLARQANGTLAISDWVIAEFSGALSIKARVNGFSAIQKSTTLSLFSELRRDAFHVFAVTSLHFKNAARLADKSDMGVRSGDALHLAICADSGSTLCTLDKRLGGAGPNLGVPTLLL